MGKLQNRGCRNWKARASLMENYHSTIRVDGKELTVSQIINEKKKDILVSWGNMLSYGRRSFEFMTFVQFSEEAKAFLNEFVDVLASHKYGDITVLEFEGLLGFLRKISKESAKQGFSSLYIANFVFSLKYVLTDLFQNYFEDSKELNNEIMTAYRLLDALGSYTFETDSNTREELIIEQNRVISLLHKNSVLSQSTKKRENFSMLLLEAID